MILQDSGSVFRIQQGQHHVQLCIDRIQLVIWSVYIAELAILIVLLKTIKIRRTNCPASRDKLVGVYILRRKVIKSLSNECSRLFQTGTKECLKD